MRYNKQQDLSNYSKDFNLSVADHLPCSRVLPCLLIHRAQTSPTYTCIGCLSIATERTWSELRTRLKSKCVKPLLLSSKRRLDRVPDETSLLVCKAMDPVTIVGLIAAIVQFVDFSSELVSSSTEIYRSTSGALQRNVHLEQTTRDLIQLNDNITDSADLKDEALRSICESCNRIAGQLTEALGRLKADKHRRWQSLTKALRSAWSKSEIVGLEQQLASMRDAVNLRITVDLRYVPNHSSAHSLTSASHSEELARQRSEHTAAFERLNATYGTTVDAILQQGSIFLYVHKEQSELIKTLHDQTLAEIRQEHGTTRRVIIDLLHPNAPIGWLSPMASGAFELTTTLQMN